MWRKMGTVFGWGWAVAAGLVFGADGQKEQPNPTESKSWHVWTLVRTERVLRSSLPGQGLAVELAACRGERESFQILVRSHRPVPGVRIEPADLVGPGGHRLPADQAELFRQHQLHITIGTYRNSQFKPDWYPDALIPARLPADAVRVEGARYTAMPFDLPAQETHGFLVDIYVPPKTPAGQYQGSYRVTAADGRIVEIPVRLTVWDFDLPRVSVLYTAFGSPAASLRSYYGRRAKAGKEPAPKDWAAIDAQCAQLLTEHRINATPPPGALVPQSQPDGSFRIPDHQIKGFQEFVDRYHVNAYCIPHPSSVVKDPVEQEAKLRAWFAAWDEAIEKINRPVLFYTYLRDEPNTEEDYRYVQRWGRAIRHLGSRVKVLVVEQPWTQNEAWGDLYGAVDIWCPLFSLFKPDSAAQRQALGEMIWTYTALCQGKPTPWWHTDYPLLHYRIPTWIAWRYRIRGLLYWGSLSFWNHVEDPWTEPWTYDRRSEGKGPVFNGEGSLLYPARAVGFEGVVPSLRLKALRDGIEDYDYLAILERLGRAAEAEKIVLELAPSWFEWEPDPAAWETARRKLAELILQPKKGAASE
ncbi:MAG: DUF4091 domain-containing protein [Thermoguttaceae bacterium]|nr:DUF4091 domain-containing protein [Thermoguttaceae bacterium]